MGFMLVFQIIPLAALGIYFLYIIYYVAVPMARLRFLMHVGYKKYHCTDIRIDDTGVIVRIMENGRERVLWRPMEIGLDMQYMAMTAATELRSIFREIRKGRV
ncbi:MAG: hypothetical protein IJH53_08080 [Oscillospiraceae bacterium]|nr:hypothetical protein [Oscillospiraceae bacterium]